MNWLRDNLRGLTALLVCLSGFALGGTLLWQSSRNARLSQALEAAASRAGALDSQLQQAERAIIGRDATIASLTLLNQQQAADVAKQVRQLAAINRNAAAIAAQFEALTHEDPDATRWGDARLPAAVVRLLYPEPVADHPAGLPAGDDLRAASEPAGQQQPRADAGVAVDPERAESLRAAG